ncbi:hypothetical protein AS9A_0767 [Hoyosella subflava DQS3-9A1]|uniref:Uncharacterized protein n=1 Tax=Hoyosella subflava (strain DSM 45089 / JCM 17490 / NBRC 109087 / DQS3-9A1) TaxID=443218 RepID=F6ELC9_HOYSD|nr:hypothetical protein AS9A_0767 [Hoyosella subflava DQS3-9A1]
MRVVEGTASGRESGVDVSCPGEGHSGDLLFGRRIPLPFQWIGLLSADGKLLLFSHDRCGHCVS